MFSCIALWADVSPVHHAPIRLTGRYQRVYHANTQRFDYTSRITIINTQRFTYQLCY